MPKYLIVNADDFGLSLGVNRGIIEAAEHGILTSASLMVRQPAAEAAADYARQGARISLGLHLDLGEWVYQNEEWIPLYSVVSTDDAAAVSDEVTRQLVQFGRLVGRPPSHLDSHQHVHRQEPVRSVVANLARKLGIPVREQTPDILYCGDFYGQTGEGETMPDVLCVDGLKRVLVSLSEGVTELGCHPGYDDGLATAYRAERALETKVLCAPEIRRAVTAMRIELLSFDDLARLRATPLAQSRPTAPPGRVHASDISG